MLVLNNVAKSQFVIKSSKFLSKSVGREKLARLGQYTSKVVYIYTGSILSNQLQQHFKFLFKCFGILKPLNLLPQLVSIEENWEFSSLISWFSLFRIYSLFLWHFFDQYNILSLFNLVNSKSFYLASSIPRITNYFWLSTLFWTVMLELRKILSYRQEIAVNKKILKNKKNTKNKVLIKSTLMKKTNICKKRSSSLRKIIASVLDSFIVLKLLNLIDNYNLLIAFFGVITSFWGMEDVWSLC